MAVLDDPIFPAKGDRLFVGPGVAVQKDEIAGWSRYENGYYAAAEILAVRLLQPDADHDLVFPALYLYRHFLELVLKGLVFEALASLRLSDDRRREVTSELGKHNLMSIWQCFCRLIRESNKSRMLAGTEKGPFEDLLREFDSHDPSSMEARYPVKKDFRTPTLTSLNEVNFEVLRESVTKIVNEIGTLYHRLQYADEPWWDDYPEVE